MSRNTHPYSFLPAALPFKLVSWDYLLNSNLKLSTHEPFRRLYMKRRTVNGAYESSWQEIQTTKVSKFGTVKIRTDDVRTNTILLDPLTIVLDNSDGYFSDENSPDSFWFGYLSQYRTMVKIECGYVDKGSGSDLEIPEDPTVFIGIVTDEIEEGFGIDVRMKVRPLSSVFDELTASELNLYLTDNLTTSTAAGIVQAVRDYETADGVSYFQQFVSSGAWSITGGSYTYSKLATSTALKDVTVFEMLRRLAEAENQTLYIASDGSLTFAPRTVANTATYHFSGGSRNIPGLAQDIVRMESWMMPVSKIYSRVRLHYLEGDSESTYLTRADESFLTNVTTTSNVYGQKTYNMENFWFADTATAESVIDDIFERISLRSKELKFVSKYHPSIDPTDVIKVTYSMTQSDTNNYIWGAVKWGSGLWNGSNRQSQELNSVRLQVTAVDHDIDMMTSAFTAREI